MEVFSGRFGDRLLDGGQGPLDVGRVGVGALELETAQRVVGHGDQRLARPRLEPVERAARNQARKLQRPAAELFDFTKANVRSSVHSFIKCLIDRLWVSPFFSHHFSAWLLSFLIIMTTIFMTIFSFKK